MSKKRYDKKTPIIVKNKMVKEEIIFKGKEIIREKIEKEWNIPKIITGDIGFQLIFGFQPGFKPIKTVSNVEEIQLNPRYYRGKY